MYTFEQLSPEAQEKALTNNREILINDNWFETVVNEWQEKLEELGYINTEIFFTGFSSQGDGACFTYEAVDTKNEKFKVWALSDISISPDTIADRVSASGRKIGSFSHENSIVNVVEVDMEGFKMLSKLKDAIFNKIEANIDYFTREVSKKIYKALNAEYDALTTDDVVKETLMDLELEFNEDGSAPSESESWADEWENIEGDQDVNTPDIIIEKRISDERGLKTNKLSYDVNYEITEGDKFIELYGILNLRNKNLDFEPGVFSDIDSENYWDANYEKIEKEIKEYFNDNYNEINHK